MDREFLDRLSPPRKPRKSAQQSQESASDFSKKRRRVNPHEFDQEIKKQLDNTHYFEWDKAHDTSLEKKETLSDEISFKPINPGLGFHPSKKTLPQKPQNRDLDHQFLRDRQDIRNSENSDVWANKPKYFSFEDAKKKTFEDTSLQPFYEPTHEANLENIFTTVKTTNSSRLHGVREVKGWKILAAWLVDCFIVGAISLLNLWLMFTVSEVPLSFRNFDIESYILSGSLFGLWYLMYFSIADFISTTLGKKIFRIKVLSSQDKAIDFSQSLLRAFFSLISIMTLGLFSLFDGPSVGSKTQVLYSGKTNS